VQQKHSDQRTFLKPVYVDKLLHTWLDDNRLKFHTSNLFEFGKRIRRDFFVVELDVRSTKCVIFVGVFQTILL